jgi:hypothetical protein
MVCAALKKGYHRVEFGVGKHQEYKFWGTPNDIGSFNVTILAPGAFDAVPITKEMMLLKKE